MSSQYTVKLDITKETVQTLFFVISRDSLYPGYIVYLIMVIYIVNSVISLLRHIIQVCSIFTNSSFYNMICECYVIANSIFDPKTHHLLISGYSLWRRRFDLPANDVSSTLSHCSFFANISLTVDSPQWKSLARSLLVREGLSSLFWHGLFFALQSMLL